MPLAGRRHRALFATLSLFVFSLAGMDGVVAQQPLGTWQAPFSATFTAPGCGGAQEKFNPVHASVIPVGPHRGKLLVWDRSSAVACSALNGLDIDRDQRWGIVDIETQTITYFSWTIPGAQAPPIFKPPLGLQNGGQGLFCAGHCWLPDGRLFVAGGDDWHSSDACSLFVGSRLVCIYDPLQGVNGTWFTIKQINQALPFCERPRWYPSLTVISDPTQAGRRVKVVIAGGIEELVADNADCPGLNNGVFKAADRAYLTHEAYDIVDTGVPAQPWAITKDQRQGGTLPPNFGPFTPINGLFQGPTLLSTASPNFQRGLSFFYYPRLHYLSSGVFNGSGFPNGILWSAGMPIETAWTDHVVNPNSWVPPQPMISPASSDLLEEPTGVLLPDNVGGVGDDRIAMIGGQYGMSHSGLISRDVYVLNAKVPNPAWSPTAIPQMLSKRKFANAVLLPDTSIYVGGGGTNPSHGGVGGEELRPEIFKNGAWSYCAAEASPRTYHSSAVLMPSARVASVGGDTRSWDYQLFEPHYFSLVGARPSITANPSQLAYGANFPVTFTLAGGRTLQRAVLITPASLTHGHDPNQRLVNLPITNPTTTSAQLAAPVNVTKAPRGWYMLFLVDNLGVPSVAAWVQLL